MQRAGRAGKDLKIISEFPKLTPRQWARLARFIRPVFKLNCAELERIARGVREADRVAERG
jgi:hypothetical protein